jgi:hypothetical protein
MNRDELDFIKDLDTRIAKIEANNLPSVMPYLHERFNAMENRMKALEEWPKSDDFHPNILHAIKQIADLTKRFQEIESQLCGAKKNRMDKLEEQIKVIKGQIDYLFDKQPEEDFVKAMQCGLADIKSKPDGTVTKQPEPCKKCGSLLINADILRKKWKPIREGYFGVFCTKEGEFRADIHVSFEKREAAESFLSKIKALREENK